MRFLHHAPASDGGRRVFIAVPCYGDLPTLTAFSLYQSQAALAEAGIEVELCILTGHCHVDDARNHLVGRFLDGACDDFMFIDADMGWQPEDLARFVQIDRDVVAGVYRKKKDDPDYTARLIPGENWADEDGLLEAEAVPTGFLKIKRHVLEMMSERFPKYRPDPLSDSAVSEIFCRTILADGARMGGDYHFCHRWRALGGRIFVDPELWLEHSGENVWAGSYGSHLRKQAGIDLLPWIEKIRNGTYERADLIPLFHEWGNDYYAAKHELLATAIDLARQARGPIIETGSGLSSLVMAATGAEVHCLESDPAWLSTLSAAKQRLGLQSLHVHFAPLVDHADGRWYSDVAVPWAGADIVLCDGPVIAHGAREVLFRVMRERGCSPRALLIDDPERTELPEGCECELIGQRKPFGLIRQFQARAAA